MYRYDEFDAAFVRQRTEQFADQVARRLSGELSEEEFRPLRLMNGVYLQLHAYMLRIAIPYGTLSPRQMRMLARIAREYDKGYGHFTTRQNIQYNWPALKDVPEVLRLLAEVEMHSIQTSGNCIRNTTADHFAGAAVDEIADPRPIAEVIRQWSSIHPEFSFLPRKFKIAVSGATTDRAAIRFHDIGLQVVRDEAGRLGYEVWVGGGQGRTPMIAKLIRPFIEETELLAYLEAVLRVYNRYGRRDNKFKARIKILVHETGEDDIRADIEEEYARLKGGSLSVPAEEIRRIETYFALPAMPPRPAASEALDAAKAADPALALFCAQNLHPHRVPGYTSLTISLKPIGGIPGDATADQMDAVADLAAAFGFHEIRVSHEQNLILPHVALDDVPDVFSRLVSMGLTTANAGLVTDIIACPGLDYCALANARSIPIAQSISERFGDLERQREIGPLSVKISGCINACGHHHVGHIGILGVDRKGEEFYQITLGGAPGEDAAIGSIIGPGFLAEQVPGAIETIVDTYLAVRRDPAEPFLLAYRRVGEAPFKEALYGTR
jgi:sulfite reductase (NADPH) hemoprotein beta-component